MFAEHCRLRLPSLVGSLLVPLWLYGCGSTADDSPSGGGAGGSTNAGGSGGTDAGDSAATGGSDSGATAEGRDADIDRAVSRDAGADGVAAAGDGALAGDGSASRLSAGCGRATTGTSTYARETITVRGTAREYFLWVPRTYLASRAYPIIFRWHGSTGDGLSGGLEIEASSRENAVIASPSGIGGDWDLTAGGVDVQLFDMVLASVEGNYCIDTGRVFSYGFSDGGGMTNLLGCVRGDVVRGLAPVEGFAPVTTGCRGRVATWITHSGDDTVVTISQGIAARTLFLALDGCGTTTMPVSPAPCVRYQGCQAGYPVDFCQTTGEHSPQGGFTGPGAWAFFNSLP